MSYINPVSPESTNIKLKVGLIVDSEFASKYVYVLAEWAQTQNDLLISHLIIQKTDNARQGKGLLNLIRRVSFALITKVENFRIRREEYYKNHLRLFNLKEIVLQSITITPITSKTEFIYRYSVEDIQKVKDLNLDVLIRCGSGILRGEILKSSRFGVISLQHANHRTNRGGPHGI